MPRRKKLVRVYKKRRWVALKIILGLFFAALLSISAVFVYFIKDLPRPEKFSEGNIAQSTKIYDRDGKVLLFEIFDDQKRTLVKLKEIPGQLRLAVVSIEDRHFFEHRGIDFNGIFRAIIYDFKLGKPVQGGSTITQQLIRSYFLTRKKTLRRKTREMVLSLELERRYSKDQILEWYLNLIPLGPNIYGVEEASETYFGKHVSKINLPEAAVLASLIKAPSYYYPFGKHIKELLQRKNLVLEKMKELGYISEKEFLEAKNKKIEFQKDRQSIKAPHFTLLVKEYLEKKYGHDFLARNGLRVYTSLDWKTQQEAEKIVSRDVNKLKTYNAHNGGLVALNSNTGEILAMVGSKDYFGSSSPPGCNPGENCKFDPKVNIALTPRQPGSALKPFVYAKLLSKGFVPYSKVWDVKTEFNTNCSPDANEEYGKYKDKCYHPKNYDDKFSGLITLRSALAQSRNLPAVKVLYLAGLNDVLDFIKKFGITTLSDKKRFGLSLVLGGGEVRLLEMVEAYAVFAENGVKVPLNFIEKIEDSNGKIIESRKTYRDKIIPSYIAKEINSILSDNNARAPMFGYNSLLHINGWEVAAKTGTTQNYRDAWTIGYTPSIVVGVWVGNNDNSPMAKKPAVVVAGTIWNDFFKKILPLFPKENFEKPDKRVPESKFLEGDLGSHSILYFLNQSDPQYPLWETGVKNFLNSF